MIRYPGSKAKIARQITDRFPDLVMLNLWAHGIEYREPFVGAGAIGFHVMRRLPESSTIWLNDKDYGIACLWKIVRDQPDELKEAVRSFQPSVDAFYQFKAEDGDMERDFVETALRKIVLHQESFSGLGFMAGGPLGGRRQDSINERVDCRWNPAKICETIKKRHMLMKRFGHVEITSGDFGKLITGAPPHTFIYADPPYYEKGPELYKFSMSDDDHVRLAGLLRASEASWVLSYDKHSTIQGLYDWADIVDVELTYTSAITKTKRRKNSEIIITPKVANELIAKGA